MKKQQIFLYCLLVFCLAFTACGGKKLKTTPGTVKKAVAQDLVTLPQKLEPYAAKAGGKKILLGGSEQAIAASNQKTALFRPWELAAPPAWIKKSLAKNFHMGARNMYTNNKRPFPMETWDELVYNSNKGAFGLGAGPAITLRHSNLRAMPTLMHFYRNPSRPGEGYPFDYSQHTSVPPGTPLYICNVSRDGEWCLADGPVTAGWIPTKDIVRVDEEFMARWKQPGLAAVLKDKTPINGARAHVGTLLPLASGAKPGLGQSVAVYYPKRSSTGKAEIGTISLAKGAATAVPLSLTPNNVASIGNQMIGQPYGWGGLDENRDCSALTRDLFAPFGIHLPRNSKSQARSGSAISLGGLDNDEKISVIKQEGEPFRSLIWMPGHIGVYLGVYNGKPVMLHNMWGIRTIDAYGECEGRAVVGKGVITTLSPGAERRDICSPGGLLDRIGRVTVVPR